jgi:hypothetical protein
MRYKILILIIFSFMSSAAVLRCSSDGYAFSVKDKLAVIVTPKIHLERPVIKTGANYSGVLNSDEYYAFRFVLRGASGELKLIGRKSLNISMTCSRF